MKHTRSCDRREMVLAGELDERDYSGPHAPRGVSRSVELAITDINEDGNGYQVYRCNVCKTETREMVVAVVV